jgi:predicted site-specific integrase-resolvase
MTTNEVAEKLGIARKTVTMWCQKNDIKRKLGVNGIMEYDITKKDIEKLKNRKPKGRPKKTDNQ